MSVSVIRHLTHHYQSCQTTHMPEYRRNRVPGGTYFFTVNLFQRDSHLLVDNIDNLRESIRTVRNKKPFHIDGWVVLPDHMHCIWTLPDSDADYPSRWKAIKTAFAKSIPKIENRSTIQLARGERAIWQRRYWEHTIRDEADYAAHMDYLHINPLKHGLVHSVADWPYSSFHRLVNAGVYPKDWAGGGEIEIEAGE